MEVMTMWSPSRKVVTPSGERYHTTYVSHLSKKGNVVLAEKGKEDWYSMIQASADSVDINLLIEKYKNGDVQALNRTKALYIDTTDLPEDYFAMVNKLNDARDMFKHLSPSIKAKFDNSFDKFIATVGSPEFIKNLTENDVQKIVQQKSIEENVATQPISVDTPKEGVENEK